MSQSKAETGRKRQSERKRQTNSAPVRGSKTICLPIERTEYRAIMNDAQQYRSWLNGLYEKYPDLFPTLMSVGYQLHDRLPASKKLPEVQLRRIARKATGAVYTVRPSFVLPYMSGYTDEVENGLFFLSFGVPFWAISECLGGMRCTGSG